MSVAYFPWQPNNPVEDPYVGLPAPPESANIVRIDIVFVGRVNPPGPLGLNGADYAPDRFGNSPAYGFFEIDIDADQNTGGEFPAQARLRTLGTGARFGGRTTDPILRERMALSSTDIDPHWTTAPFFERTGTDFAISLCGCHNTEIVSQTGDCDGKLDDGEQMTVRGRFFQRAGGYRPASFVIGGSDIGMYDPVVNMRFTHEPSSNLTIVTLVLPLTPAGAAALTGEPEQPIDESIGDGSHFSILEALTDLVNAAHRQNSGLTAQLISGWSKKDPAAYLNPMNWSAHALVGTAYAQPEDSLYAWTDIGFDITTGDINGDGVVLNPDRVAVQSYIAMHDGSWADADGEVNGAVVLADPGTDFSLYDMTGDGVINTLDIAWFEIPTPCPGDWDGNGRTDVPDIFAFLASWFAGSGDFDRNGVNDVPDIFAFLAAWFSSTCI